MAPLSGVKPRGQNGSQNRADSEAMVKSAASASWKPRPAGPTPDGTDDGDLDRRDDVHEPMGLERGAALEVADAGSLAAAVAGHHVGTGAEVRTARRDEDRSHRIVERHGLERDDHLAHVEWGQRVLGRGPIEDQVQDGAGGLDANGRGRLVGHETSLATESKIDVACDVAVPKVFSSTHARFSR